MTVQLMKSIVEELDTILSGHPFGDDRYIRAEADKSYMRRLERLSGQIEAARALYEALLAGGQEARFAVTGNPVLRCAIQHSQVRLERGADYGLPLELCSEVYEAAADCVRQGKPLPFPSSGTPAAVSRCRAPETWRPDRADNVFGRAFAAIVARDHPDATPSSPAPEEAATLSRSAELLALILPKTARSALSHTAIVAIFPQEGSWRTRFSSSEFRISGAVFLSRRALADPWVAAEHLFHESLHQQLYDFRAGHSLLQPDFAREGAPLVWSPWNRPSGGGNYWDVHRALAAFHVYVHLLLLVSLAEEAAPRLTQFGPMKLTGRRTAAARAHYLEEQLRTICWNELGLAGQSLVSWFGSILTLLDPAAPAAGAYVHLLLDRYWREAAEVAGRLRDPATNARLSPLVSALLDREVSRVREIVRGSSGDVNGFEEALGRLPRNRSETYFVSTRTLVAKSILELCPDSFRLCDDFALDAAVKDMVEESSHALEPLLAA
jgi:hypothetical protein